MQEWQLHTNWLHLMLKSMKYSQNGTRLMSKVNMWSREKLSWSTSFSTFPEYAWLCEKCWEDLRRKEENKVPLLLWKLLLSTLCLFCISLFILHGRRHDICLYHTFHYWLQCHCSNWHREVFSFCFFSVLCLKY